MTRKGAIKQYAAPIRRASSCHKIRRKTNHVDILPCVFPQKMRRTETSKKMLRCSFVSHTYPANTSTLPAKQMHTRDRFCPARRHTHALRQKRLLKLIPAHWAFSPENGKKVSRHAAGLSLSLLIIHLVQTLVIDSGLNNYFVRNVCSGKTTLAPGALHGAFHIYSGR
jgi:hypothetical protein